ncbi:hypothetical protein C8R46DRAFT_1237068 [Mycena filopes]|nr:hypothetical protein C8R46DRAFT_1237068 [Mycena filopes]
MADLEKGPGEDEMSWQHCGTEDHRHSLDGKAAATTTQSHLASSTYHINRTPQFPEGGTKAYLAVLGAFLAMFCTFGQLNAFGTYQTWYAEHQLSHLEPATIAWIGSMQLWVFFFSGGPIGQLFDAYGPRWIMAGGSVLYVFAIMMTSISTQYYQYLLAHGIVFGLGVGMLFYPSMSSVSTYFSKYRATALGIVASGSSFGGVVYPIMLQRLFETASSSRSSSSWTTRGTSRSQRTTPSSCSPVMNAGGVIGRVAPNILSDRIGRFNLLVPASFLSGLLCVCFWLFARSLVPLMLFAAAYGFSSGAFISVITPCVAQISDIRQIGSRIGALYTPPAHSSGDQPPARFSRQARASTTGMILFAGLTVIAGSFLILAAKLKIDSRLVRGEAESGASVNCISIITTFYDSSLELTGAEGLWFEDCGLIIQAETTLFRVSRDFLAMRSPVFGGNACPLPTPQDAELMEGCPFVRLPDSAEDVTLFPQGPAILRVRFYYIQQSLHLSALQRFFEPPPTKTSFSVVAGILRMSHKYEVDVLRKRALIHLSSACPTTLSGWDTRLTEQTWFPLAPAHYFEAISLARQTSALWILPLALYRACAALDIGEIMMGTEGHVLSPADAVTCARGLRFLDTTATSQALNFLSSPTVPGCESPHACAARKREGHIKADEWRKYEFATEFRPCPPLEIWDDGTFERLEVCAVCKPHLRSAHALARQAIWDRLPDIFALPSWTELTQMKADALE